MVKNNITIIFYHHCSQILYEDTISGYFCTFAENHARNDAIHVIYERILSNMKPFEYNRNFRIKNDNIDIKLEYKQKQYYKQKYVNLACYLVEE